MRSSKIRARCLASTRIATKTSEPIRQSEEPESHMKREEREHETEPESEDEGGTYEDARSELSSSSTSSPSTVSSQYTIQQEVVSPSLRHVSCIQEVQLSPDGTCIFTTDYERKFTVYPLDRNIFEEKETRTLNPYAQFDSADPIWTFAINPWFDVNYADTTTVLASRRDQYISLHNALWDTSRSYSAEENVPRTGPVDISNKLASYKLIDHLTEEVIAPLSLTYSNDGAYFYAGYQNTIAIFDLSYTEDPIVKISTIPSTRNKLKGGGVGFKGHISALSVSSSSLYYGAGILAAGSRTRYVGLYDSMGGQEITHLTLPGKSDRYGMRDSTLSELSGQGVTHLKWSADGNYLYITERHSDVILIYDVRKFSLMLGYCAGRAALTNQKLCFDLWSPPDTSSDVSQEVWAGGTDGKIRVWRDPHLKEGRVDPDDVIDVGNVPVVSALVHPYGHLAVAASGTIEGTEGKKRTDWCTPTLKDWGCLDILGFGSY
jgi:hypothetical protein